MWGALKQRQWMRALRSLGFWATFVVLLLFFMIPVTFIQVGGGACLGAGGGGPQPCPPTCCLGVWGGAPQPCPPTCCLGCCLHDPSALTCAAQGFVNTGTGGISFLQPILDVPTISPTP